MFLTVKPIIFRFCSIAECFAFLVCTKWSNPVIHRSSQTREASSSSSSIRYLEWNSGLVVSAEEDQEQDQLCGLQDIGGHIMKIPVIGFQILLCMRLEVGQSLSFCSSLLWILFMELPWFQISGNPWWCKENTASYSLLSSFLTPRCRGNSCCI